MSDSEQLQEILTRLEALTERVEALEADAITPEQVASALTAGIAATTRYLSQGRGGAAVPDYVGRRLD